MRFPQIVNVHIIYIKIIDMFQKYFTVYCAKVVCLVPNAINKTLPVLWGNICCLRWGQRKLLFETLCVSGKKCKVFVTHKMKLAK